MPDVNRRQAQVPRGAHVLDNPHGTAPGLWIDAWASAVIALLPGPPREMKPMMDGQVRQRLARIAGDVRLYRRMLRVSGKGESHVEEIVQPIYSRWLDQAPPIETTILAVLGQVELHLRHAVGRRGAAATRRWIARWPSWRRRSATISSAPTAPVLEAVVGDLLRARGWWVAVGGILHRRPGDVAPDGRPRQLGLRRAQRRRLQQPREDRAARRARAADRRARRGQRAGRAWRWPRASETRTASTLASASPALPAPAAGANRSRSALSASRSMGGEQVGAHISLSRRPRHDQGDVGELGDRHAARRFGDLPL